MITPAQRINPDVATFQAALKQALCRLRVAIPGIIQEFDPVKLVAQVQIAIRENVLQQIGLSGTQPVFENKDITVLPLANVPVVFIGDANYALTFPDLVGAECLVVFSDMAIDGWWQNGGVQNQVEIRRHDLWDGIAIVGPRSQQNLIPNYSTDAVQLRSQDGTFYIELGTDAIRLVMGSGASYIELTSDGTVNIVAPGGVNINGAVVATGEGTFNGIEVSQHKHTDVMSGSDETGLPTG